MSWRIGIIGFGKIAQDQHLPAIAANPAFELAGVVSPHAPAPAGVPRFADHLAMLAALPGSPPRAAACSTPPGIRAMRRRSRKRGGGSRAKWCAACASSGRRVRRWHPGQQWIWQAGGFGVFDPGINALSIATSIMPAPLFVRHAELYFPANRDTPIAADLDLGEGFAAVFDWRQTGDQIWEIEADTDAFRLKLAGGGGRLDVDGELITDEARAEYAAIYRRFDDLLRAGTSDVDAAPLRLVADAFMIGRRASVEPFQD